MSEHFMQIRRAVVRLSVGATTTLRVASIPIGDAIAEAARFAKVRKLSIEVKADGDTLVLARHADAIKISMYPELDALEVGQSHLFKLPGTMHQRVRLAASSRNKTGLVRLSCIRETDGIRVTRLPLTEAEQQACGPIQSKARQSKYDLDRLSNQRQIVFDVPREDRAKLRLAVSNYAARQNWTIRCRLQDDGTMLVYRNDAGAPAADSSLSTITERP